MSNSEQPSVETWEFLIPIAKGQKDPVSGARRVHGIATDEKIDVENDIVKASGVPDVLKYLNECGAFNYDHHKTIIGKVSAARFMSNGEAARQYGKSFVGTPVQVAGEIHPILDYDRAPDDLKEVHRLLDSGQPMYFSIQGTRAGQKMIGRGVTETTPGIITQVAITAQPKNTNAVCVMAKSMADLVEKIESEPERDSGTHIVYMCKGMETTGVVPTAGTTGADASKSEDMGGVASESLSCASCGHKMEKGDKYCSDCGAMYKSVSEMIADLLKA